MEPGLASRRRSEDWLRSEGGPLAARPLVRPAPRSAMFFPLVVVAAVLPGLYALNSWDLTPPGPWWGLRALAVLDGWTVDQVPAALALKPSLESRAFQRVAIQPPLYAWLEAAGLALSSDNDPRATVLPSYMAGALIVILVYLHGRLWRGPGHGLVAAILTAFNSHLLLQMQQATPTTLGLAGALGALLGYGGHRKAIAESRQPWAWGGTVFWTVVGGLSLGLSLLALGGLGLLAIPIVVLHQIYLRAGLPPAERSTSWWRAWLENPSLRAGAVALTIGLLVAAPWYAKMLTRYGVEFLVAILTPLSSPGFDHRDLLSRLIDLAPATMPLGIFGAFRMARLALTDENEEPGIVGGILWVVWLAVAAVTPALWPAGPRHALAIFLLVPLNLLAAQAIADLANRRIPIRTLAWLAPATACSIVWWWSEELQNAVDDLAHGRASTATALGLHLALDLLVAVVFITHRLDRWARRRDDRQRSILAGFLAVVLTITVAVGIREVMFRHSETNDLLMLRAMILRSNREHKFDVVAVVGPDLAQLGDDGVLPGGRLRFILRTALPDLPQHDLNNIDDLLRLPDGQRLVILAGMGQRPFGMIKSQMNLIAIHPGSPGTLEAFATNQERSQPARR